MTEKKCMVFETLNNVHSMQISEGSNANEVRLTGVFGVCGIKNGNNRIYDKGNYGKMVEALQNTIVSEGCPGELEHPNTMNIDLNNISHKIESIEMNEDGTITGTILLLNTPKGQIAKAIVEGGLPLYISSRGAGSIDESGHVTLSTIKTYDLVGTPGFSQAKLSLKKNQTFECLNESLEDGNLMYAIVESDEDDNNDVVAESNDVVVNDTPAVDNDATVKEGDDLLGDDNADKKDDDKKDDSADDKKDDSADEKSDDSDDKKDDEDSKDDEKDDNKNSDSNTTMEDIKKSIDALTEKVTSLEAELHVAQESINAKDAEIANLTEKMNEFKSVNYDAIEQWVKDEFAPEFKESIDTDINDLRSYVNEEFAETVQNWVCEEFAPEVQNWVCEEFAPEVQNWVCEEFAPEVQNWVCEEFAPEVQNWICEEFAPVVEGWICEEFAPENNATISEAIETKVNENVSAFMESQKDSKISEIDALLDTIAESDNAALAILKEQKTADKFAGVFAVENMPAQYQPSWNSLNESRQAEIVRTSKAYDFTKEGVLESFWANVDFAEKPVVVNESKDVVSDYHNNVFAQMMRLRK